MNARAAWNSSTRRGLQPAEPRVVSAFHVGTYHGQFTLKPLPSGLVMLPRKSQATKGDRLRYLNFSLQACFMSIDLPQDENRHRHIPGRLFAKTIAEGARLSSI
jgi:hypothetical protein